MEIRFRIRWGRIIINIIGAGHNGMLKPDIITLRDNSTDAGVVCYRERVGWKNNADGFLIDKSKKDLTHLSDAADYGLWNTRVITDTDNSEQYIYIGKRRESR